MNSFFGIGTLELVVIIIIAAVVMGPERIVQTARWLGQKAAYFQRLSQGFALQLRHELDQIDDKGELRQMVDELQKTNQIMQREVQDIRKQFLGVSQEVRGVVEEANAPIEDNSIAPPRPLDELSKPSANGHGNGNGQNQPTRLPKPLEIEDDE